MFGMGVEDKHLLFSMPLPKSQFDAIHTGRADPSRYLIIGFDTEYQRFADEITRTLNNEVLSYQYCCTVIERDGDDNAAPLWSGLLKPKGPKVEDRLSLEEFLVEALTDGCSRFPHVKLPSTIYLVAPSSSDLFRIIGRIWSLARSLPNEPLAEFERLLKEEPSTTEVERLRKERIGQNVFRSALMDYWEKSCAVTVVQNPTLLRASHIIPWATCESDKERLNVHNGLLLVATLDAAFDAGLITFEDDGRILISGKLSERDQISSGIGQHMRLTRMNDEVRKRLAWHRAHLFEGTNEV
jgi:hypothetical protein